MFLLIMDGAVIFFTIHMDDEFDDWAWIMIITFWIDTVLWETICGVIQATLAVLFVNGRKHPSKIMKLILSPPFYDSLA